MRTPYEEPVPLPIHVDSSTRTAEIIYVGLLCFMAANVVRVLFGGREDAVFYTIPPWIIGSFIYARVTVGKPDGYLLHLIMANSTPSKSTAFIGKAVKYIRR